MSTTKIKLLVIIPAILFLLYHLISFFSTIHLYAAGRYPYAATYHLHYPEKNVIKAMEMLKLKNADFKDKDTTDYWHDISFDLEDKKVQVWTRPFNENETEIALVAVYKNKKSGWQLVNQDLGLFENILTKRAFEKAVPEKLQMELER